MRPTLLALGPWPLNVLPILFAVFYLFALLWLWGEARWGGGPPVTSRRALWALLPAGLLAGVVFALIHQFGPIEIKSWGTMLVLAFVAGSAYMIYYGDRRVLTPAECLDVALYTLVGAVIGARLLYVALDWPVYSARLYALFNVWEGGLSFHGGLIGGILGVWIYCRRRQKSFGAVMDQGAPAVALGYVFARLGCFLNGCCHGHESHLPWAMRFPHGELPNVPVHPTQLYAALSSLVILGILLQLRKIMRRPGHLFVAYLGLYSIARFLLEFTRAGATGRFMKSIPGLTIAQFASLIILVASASWIAATWPRSHSQKQTAEGKKKAARK